MQYFIFLNDRKICLKVKAYYNLSPVLSIDYYLKKKVLRLMN